MEFWADGVVAEFPLAPEGFPNRIEGKSQLTATLGNILGPDALRKVAYHDISIHPTLDPEVFFVEYVGDNELLSGGTYNNVYCSLVQVRNDKIVFFREYSNPVTFAKAFPNWTQKASS